jgi:hypothetical protein
MKQLHRRDLWSWSTFDEARNLDFHSVVWVRPEGNIVIDPLPLSDHDRAHLEELGGVHTIIVTNSDHVRATGDLTKAGVRVLGPRGEATGSIFCERGVVGNEGDLACDGFLDEGDTPVPGMKVYAMEGSKTPGELALLVDGSTLICGDLVRAHEGGRLCMLPDPKLSDRAAAIASVLRLASIDSVEAVLPSDGWPIFRHGAEAMRELAARLETA